jgi:hypothetical protein
VAGAPAALVVTVETEWPEVPLEVLPVEGVTTGSVVDVSVVDVSVVDVSDGAEVVATPRALGPGPAVSVVITPKPAGDPSQRNSGAQIATTPRHTAKALSVFAKNRTSVSTDALIWPILSGLNGTC